MPYPHVLTGLTEREAIADVLYRGLLAVDKNDLQLFHSCWTTQKEPCVRLGEREMKGQEAVDQFLMGRIGAMDTAHAVSNLRINIADDAKTAHVTATILAQHYRHGQGLDTSAPHMFAGGLYELQMVKDGEDVTSWKVREWVVDIRVREGDNPIMQG